MWSQEKNYQRRRLEIEILDVPKKNFQEEKPTQENLKKNCSISTNFQNFRFQSKKHIQKSFWKKLLFIFTFKFSIKSYL